MSSKYQLLARYLRQRDQDMIRMTFKEVEDQIQGKLPPTAWEHRAWWANSETNAHARHGWMNVGYEASSVDMEAQELVFLRAGERMLNKLSFDLAPAPNQRAPQPRSQRKGDSRLEAILRSAGGVDNLAQIVGAIQQYIAGDLLETELGRILRKLWPRR